MAEAPPRLWVTDLRPGAEVNELYAVRTKDLRQRRGGGAYLVLTLSDRTGQVTALAWEGAEHLGRLCEIGGVVRVQGNVQRYNGRLQVVVRSVVPSNLEEVNLDQFVRASAVDPDVLWRRLMEHVESIADPNLRQLLFRIYSDPEVADRVRLAPAARSLHHAFRSGLIEHTVSLTSAARGLARHYRLNESLVTAGALLHDLGKVWELEAGASIEYTDDGRLIGHLSLVVLYVERRISELPTFPAELRRQLLHILLAHHGEYAYGSPRRPKTPEALLVHMVDNLDAKLAGMLEAIAEGGDGDEPWTPYVPMLERYIYRRRLVDPEAPE